MGSGRDLTVHGLCLGVDCVVIGLNCCTHALYFLSM